MTIHEMLQQRARAARGGAAVFHASGRRWHAVSLDELLRRSARAAAWLEELGLAPGDRLGILCRTRIEWLIAELAAMSAGLVVVGIDAHASPDQIAHILRDADVTGLVADDDTALRRLADHGLARLRVLVTLDASDASSSPGVRVHRWPGFLVEPPKAVAPSQDVRSMASSRSTPAPDAPATLLYTSGTTGSARGIVYRHAQLALACNAILGEFPGLARRGATTICWLPMAALFQRMMNYVALTSGVAIYFVEDPTTIVAAARRIKPTYFIGVPRFFEKLYQGIQQQLAGRPSRARRLVEYALAHSPRAPDTRRRRAAVRGRVLDFVVLRRLRAVLGRKLRFMITGSAPAPLWMLEYFDRIGILLLEAYGLSENTVPIAANRPNSYRFGSVGKVFAANDVRISGEGEILVRGPGLFDGYVGAPSGALAGMLTDDGYYRTGDLGHFDRDGFLFISGRQSDLFKTSTGRWIAPARLEAAYKKIAYLDQIVVVGRGRPFPAALVFVNDALLRQAAGPHIDEDVSTTARDRRVQADLDAAGSGLAEYERVHRFAFLPEPLSLAHGELTATLKLRRDRIEQRHAALIAQLYADLP